MIMAIDARMKEGVGTLIRNVVMRTAERVERMLVLGDPSAVSGWGALPKTVEIIPFTSPIYGWREQLRFPASKLGGCNVVHIPHFNVPIRTLPCPLIVSIHDTAHLAGILPMSVAYRAAALLYYRHAVRRARHIITGSSFSKGEIISRLNVNPEKITVIPDGVDSAKFHRQSEGRIRQVLSRLGFARPYIMILGSVRPHKNIGMALRAFEILKIRKGIPHRLVIVGRKEGFRVNAELPGISKHISQDVVFTGFLSEEEIIALYSGADLFLFQSLYEGFGLPPLEAMSCGTPVAASRIASIPEVVGEAGAYFDPHDPESVSETVLGLLNDKHERDRLSRAGKIRAEMFTWERTAEGHFSVYTAFAR